MAQLTDTCCPILGEHYFRDGVRNVLAFFDGLMLQYSTSVAGEKNRQESRLQFYTQLTIL